VPHCFADGGIWFELRFAACLKGLHFFEDGFLVEQGLRNAVNLCIGQLRLLWLIEGGAHRRVQLSMVAVVEAFHLHHGLGSSAFGRSS
jgi:hypothetical protein